MKGIYFTTMCDIMNVSNNVSSGIQKKIRQQFDLLQNSGIDMYFYYSHNNSRLYKIVHRMPFFRDRFLLPDEVLSSADFIYLRKPFTINMGYIDFLKRIRNSNSKIKVLLEIPTYPYDNEIQGLKDLPLKLKDRYARKKLKDYVDVALTYSDDKKIFGMKTLNISNGVDALRISKMTQQYPYAKNDKLRFIACAKFSFWHGYDRVIEGLYQYFQKPNAYRNIEIEMVGDGDSVELYKQLVRKYNLQNYVKFYGVRQGDDLIKIYSKCDIGFDSMGRHRSGVFYNSSLKGKEYCAYGLMIVSGVKTELDNVKDFEYYYRIPADDSPVDFEKIIEFYNAKMVTDKIKVKNKIADYAKKHFSMEVVFQPIIDFIKQGC